MPKKYTPQERERAVRMVGEQVAEFGSVTSASEAVGRKLGISRETLRRWVAQDQVDTGARPGVTTEEAEQIRELKAKVRRLEEDNAILKAAATFFASMPQ